MPTLRARLVLPIASPAVENGFVRIEDDRIVEMGSGRPAGAHDLGDVVLLPGLINAHCHLDYTIMRGAILPQAGFSQWIRRINELKRTLDDGAYLNSIAAGFAELALHGTSTVLNIESFPELMLRLPPPPLRTWWFYELLDIRSRVHTEEVVAGALQFFDARPNWTGGFGLSPHAPYTTSTQLYSLARFCCEKYGMPFMTHLAESDEEFWMFRDASGPLHAFLKALGRSMSDTGGTTPIRHLLEAGALPDGALLTHMNLLDEADWKALQGRDFSIVHCPRCHEYFQRPPFPLERFLSEGFNVCLGTDSLASNRTLDLFAEMRAVQSAHPGVRPAEILRMTTANGALALGMAGKLGELRPGAFADLTAIPFEGRAEEAVEAVIAHRGPVSRLFVAGRELSLPIPVPTNA
ncbi:MAG: amidohydrolase family protein [Terrimicrobiaceae bacterium]|nr:amidohydrolase family protein [Terrimicrobiaceae bacterium]